MNIGGGRKGGLKGRKVREKVGKWGRGMKGRKRREPERKERKYGGGKGDRGGACNYVGHLQALKMNTHKGFYTATPIGNEDEILR